MTRSSPTANDDHEALGREPRQRASAYQTLGAAFLAFLIAALLGSGSLVGLAERQPVGATRDRALSAAEGLDRFANFLSLNRPADALNEALGRDVEEIDLDELLAERQNQQPTVIDPTDPEPQTPDPNITIPTPIPDVTDPGVVPLEPTATPVPTPDTNLRTITSSEPLRLYLGGDSMSREMGEGVARVSPIDTVDPILDSQVSSGLSRPDFLDWPQRLAQRVSDNPPDAMVVMFGANDYQNVDFEGRVLNTGTQEWLDLYRTRVALAMDILQVPGVTVHWVGQPVMRPGVFSSGAMESLNAIYAEEAAKRPWVQYIDTYSLFTDGNGNFAQFIDGTDMRQSDGIHLSLAGADRMGRAVWAAVAETWGLAS